MAQHGGVYPGTALLEPGQRVRLPARPEWGEGQIQSVIGARVTVNFEHAGKVLIDARAALLECVDGRDALAVPRPGGDIGRA